MQRKDFEHLIRGAAAITDEYEIVIVGSQAILGVIPNAPASLLQSMDADVYPLRRPDLSDVIDGAIGEGSPFLSVGRIAVTNHGEAEVVVLSRAMYVSLVDELRKNQDRKAAELDVLRRRFDERLASLKGGDAADRLRAAMDRPATLGGRVKAGAGY